MSEKDKAELPEWFDCQSMFADGVQTPLSEFIREYEPVDPQREPWREGFKAALATVRKEEREAEQDRIVTALRDLKQNFIPVNKALEIVVEATAKARK